MNSVKHGQKKLELEFALKKHLIKKTRYLWGLVFCVCLCVTFILVLFVGGIILGALGVILGGWCAGMIVAGTIGGFLSIVFSYYWVDDHKYILSEMAQAQLEIDKHDLEPIEYESV